MFCDATLEIQDLFTELLWFARHFCQPLSKHTEISAPKELTFWCVVLVAQPCPTLCNPMDCSLPGSSVHEIFQARILEWVAIFVNYIRTETKAEIRGRVSEYGRLDVKTPLWRWAGAEHWSGPHRRSGIIGAGRRCALRRGGAMSERRAVAVQWPAVEGRGETVHWMEVTVK